MSYWSKSYNALSEIIRKGAFINLTLNGLDEEERSLVTKIVYGVAEKYFELNYVLSKFTKSPPKPSVRIVIMQALYALRYLSIPSYAVVNESVNLTAEIGVKELKGFVNAVLNRAARGEYPLPGEMDEQYLEVKYNLPLWLIGEVKREYPVDFDRILSAAGREEEHIRLGKRLSPGEFLKGVESYEKTATGYYVKNTPYVKDLFNKGLLTYQSFTSTLAVEAMGDITGKTLLDICAAPGGKSVYAAEKGARVTAADLYPHRVELIKSYARRMGVKLNAVQSDATVLKREWKNAFDTVLVDAPCSGLGVLSKRRDIIFKRSLEDIGRLAALQLKILNNAARYVKDGGFLVYSTCTILSKENRGVVDEFLKENSDFKLEKLNLNAENTGDIQFLPDGKGTDGFYIAGLRKTKRG